MSLSDGKYTFNNTGHPNSKLDLFGAAAVAPITGLNSAMPQKWIVVNVGNNQIHIQNGTTSTSYVSVPKSALDIALVGSTNAYPWVALPVPGVPSTYYFTTVDGKYTWNLSSDGAHAVIALKTMSSQIPDGAKWKLTDCRSGKPAGPEEKRKANQADKAMITKVWKEQESERKDKNKETKAAHKQAIIEWKEEKKHAKDQGLSFNEAKPTRDPLEKKIPKSTVLKHAAT